MKKALIVLAVLLFIANSFSQRTKKRYPSVKGKIVFKDGTAKEGFIKLSNSVYAVRFKNEEKEKLQKEDYKVIDRIVINLEKPVQRTFQYLKNYDDKSYRFVELITNDVVSVYVSTKDKLALFYSDEDSNIWVGANIVLPNGNEVKAPENYARYNLFKHKLDKYQFYLLVKGQEKLIKVESNKKFIKKSLAYFDCPEFVSKCKSKEITTNDLVVLTAYYKDICK